MAAAPARAVNLEFNGTISAICSLAIGVNGTLGLSDDGTVLGSDEAGGLPGTVLVLSIGNNTINVDAPQRVSAAPSGYNTASEQVEVAYTGLNGLSAIGQGYTNGATSFTAANIPLSTLSVNNRIVNPNGFVAGTYTTQTVVTCN